jgi:hypothetical protein
MVIVLANPPFRIPESELERLSTRQLEKLYALKRHPGPEGIPKLPEFGAVRIPSAREEFGQRCYLLGITDPATVARLWEEEKERLRQRDERVRAKARESRGRRRRRQTQ